MEKFFSERIEKYPELKKYIEQMLDVVENIEGRADKANDAEILVVENMRKFGATALQKWAEQRDRKATEKWTEEHPESKKHGKKSPLGNNPRTSRSYRAALFVSEKTNHTVYPGS